MLDVNSKKTIMIPDTIYAANLVALRKKRLRPFVCAKGDWTNCIVAMIGLSMDPIIDR